MSKSNVPDAWNDLSSDEIVGRLSDLGLVLCKADVVVVCFHCKYSLQPSGQTVSKHLWEKHSLPAKDRAGLNAFVRGLELQDPNVLPPSPDESPAHPHLAVQRGVTCLQCRYRTISPTLLQRHMAKEHGQRKCRDGSDKDILWAEASLQSWSQQGKRDFWIVETTREDGPLLVEQSPRRKRRLSQIRKEEVERLARRQHSMEAGDREDPLLSSNWMRRTGWTKLFSGTNRSILVALSRPSTLHADGFDVGGEHGQNIVFSTADERRLVQSIVSSTDARTPCVTPIIRSAAAFVAIFPAGPTSHRSSFLIHDSASGPVDFSGPRCILPIGSSAFHEPALARQRVYARLRVRASSSVHCFAST